MARRARSVAAQAAAIEEEGPINLTPLIDVVFVVLIMFIIVVPMLETEKIQLARAAERAADARATVQESSPVAIRVRADNTIWIANKEVSEEELLPILRAARQEHPGSCPQLFHDKKAQFGIYQSIKNSLERAGFEELEIVLEPG